MRYFDSTTKHLIERDPAAWLDLLGVEFAAQTAVSLIDADLASIHAAADKLFQVSRGESVERLVHMEAQASYELDIMRRMPRYNVLAEVRHDVPVWSVLMLLRKAADGPALKPLNDAPVGPVSWARYVREDEQASPMTFDFSVVRAWLLDTGEVLDGPVATLPFAPITDGALDRLPGVVQRIQDRFDREVESELAEELWITTRLLMGLRYKPNDIVEVLKGTDAMKESSVYQDFLRKGALANAREFVLTAGTERFGEPPPEIRSRIETITSLEWLRQALRRALKVNSWEELLADIPESTEADESDSQ